MSSQRTRSVTACDGGFGCDAAMAHLDRRLLTQCQLPRWVVGCKMMQSEACTAKHSVRAGSAGRVKSPQWALEA